MTPLREAATVEFGATAFLLIAVVGSAIAAERLSGGNVGLALLANAIATGAALFVLILTCAPISGAHMNPAVTLGALMAGSLSRRTAAAYVAAQVFGAVAGTWVAHLMFDVPILQISQHLRAGFGQLASEVVATGGLLLVIAGGSRHTTPVLATAVAAYITGAYWFTASTSFANPAVTLARTLTDTLSGIRPMDAPLFILAQLATALAVSLLLRRRVAA